MARRRPAGGGNRARQDAKRKAVERKKRGSARKDRLESERRREEEEDQYIDDEPHFGKTLALVLCGVVVLLVVVLGISQIAGGPPQNENFGPDEAVEVRKSYAEIRREQYQKHQYNVAVLRKYAPRHEKMDDLAFDVLVDLRLGRVDAIEKRYHAEESFDFYKDWYREGSESRVAWKDARRRALTDEDFAKELRQAFEIVIFESRFADERGSSGYVLARVADKTGQELDLVFLKFVNPDGRYYVQHIDRKPFYDYYQSVKAAGNRKWARFDERGGKSSPSGDSDSSSGKEDDASGADATPSDNAPGGEESPGNDELDAPADPAEANIRRPLKVLNVDRERLEPALAEARKTGVWRGRDFEKFDKKTTSPFLVNELIRCYEDGSRDALIEAMRIAALLWDWHKFKLDEGEGFGAVLDKYNFDPVFNGQKRADLGRVILNWKDALPRLGS